MELNPKEKKMISKELLSEVLGCDCSSVYFEDTYNLIHYEYQYDVTWSEYIQYSKNVINIYELAHKCKELALKLDYKLSSSMTDGRYDECVLRICMGNELLFEASTEPEVIFKACQWILDNKDKQ